MIVPSKVAGEFAPAGKLRSAINLGNPVLARRDPASGSPVGVSIDLAANFAERLGVKSSSFSSILLIEGCYRVRQPSKIRKPWDCREDGEWKPRRSSRNTSKK